MPGAGLLGRSRHVGGFIEVPAEGFRCVKFWDDASPFTMSLGFVVPA